MIGLLKVTDERVLMFLNNLQNGYNIGEAD